MKTSISFCLMLLSGIFFLLSCNDDDKVPPYEECPADQTATLGGSVGGHRFGGSYTLTLNDEKTDHLGHIVITFDSLSATTVSADVVLTLSEGEGKASAELPYKKIQIWLDQPITLTGKIYDVEFDYEANATKLRIDPVEYTDPPVNVTMSGWMKDEWFSRPATRICVGVMFEGEIELGFTIGENTYKILAEKRKNKPEE